MFRIPGFAAVADDMPPEKTMELLMKTTSPDEKTAMERALTMCFMSKIQPGRSLEEVKEAWERYSISRAFKNLRIIPVIVEPSEDPKVAMPDL